MFREADVQRQGGRVCMWGEARMQGLYAAWPHGCSVLISEYYCWTRAIVQGTVLIVSSWVLFKEYLDVKEKEYKGDAI